MPLVQTTATSEQRCSCQFLLFLSDRCSGKGAGVALLELSLSTLIQKLHLISIQQRLSSDQWVKYGWLESIFVEHCK